MAPTVQMPLQTVTQRISQAIENGNNNQAKHWLLQVIEQCPNEEEPPVLLMNLLSRNREINEAELLAKKILRLYPKSAEVLQTVAAFYRGINRIEDALDILNSALPVAANKCAIYRNIAFTYTTMGNTEEAIKAFKQALAINKRDIYAYWGYLRLDIKNFPEALIEDLQQVLQACSNDKKLLAAGSFTLAWYYEKRDLQRYWKYLHIANGAVDTSAEYISTAGQNNHRLFSAEHLAAQPAAQPPEQRPVFIVAPPRSGTTLLEQILGAHHLTKGTGESLAFNHAVNETCKAHRLTHAIKDWPDEHMPEYAELLNKSFLRFPLIKEAKGHVVVDKSIENFKFVGAILSAFPQAKIIRLRRHPLDTLLSCYHQFFESSYDQLFNLDALANYYLEFEQQMDYWETAYPNQIFRVKYEDLVGQPEGIIPELVKFCGLPWDDACLSHHTNVGTIITSSDIQVRQPVHTKAIAKWKHHEKYLAPVINIIDPVYPLDQY
ncbi:tetratricopeptide repeat-containing sulfotransferase family protein [Oceanicoccus sagamiensis]|uniref:tetratricopeptide repeat-containing sulfotransferase family protein n=1 Tax=Oceanicoccus sagamiensis TaxID=716816 RepID=UPI001469AC05|nr:sulfotransferase [Oceanicoccus sagamiensis]